MKLTFKSVEGRGIRSERGFTLVELLVVIFIMTMISGITIANFRQAERQKRVEIAADVLVNAIRNAQNYTLAGKEIVDPANPSCRKPVSYFTRITNAGVVTLYGVTSCATVVVETYPLPQNTRIQTNGLQINGIPGGNTLLNINFSSPFALVTAGGDVTSSSSFTSATITIESTQGAISKTVRVDGVSGRIGE